MRVGIGYDLHRLASGRRLILGGVEIAHPLGLAGHSDADVLTHAVMDALLGAAALGDIGTHFPDSEPQFKDARSLDLLRQVVAKCRDRGLAPANLDATIIAERPRLQPHLAQMCANLAEALAIDAAMVSVKATTNEGIGALGQGEAMAALAVCLLQPVTSQNEKFRR